MLDDRVVLPVTVCMYEIEKKKTTKNNISECNIIFINNSLYACSFSFQFPFEKENDVQKLNMFMYKKNLKLLTTLNI